MGYGKSPTIDQQTALLKSSGLRDSLVTDRRKTMGLLAIAFTVVILLEYATPSAYVFGYLYTGPIVLACFRLRRPTAYMVILAACVSTLLNLVVPQMVIGDLPVVANRTITVLVLVVTGWLSDRNQRNKVAIAQQRVEIQAQQKLADVRANFVATLTHDLKTPLLGAIDALQSLQQQQFGPISPEQHQVFGMMHRSQTSMLRMVEMLLDIYRNDSEGLDLECQLFDLRALTTEVLSQLAPFAANRHIELVLHPMNESDSPEAWVQGDPLQLQRVLNNLVINGINHAPRNSTVAVQLSVQAAHVTVQVLDSGPGIDPDDAARLFEQFYQGRAEQQTCGSGLGLYLSRQIIEAHGGNIWARNRSPHGAAFGFKLRR